MRLLGRLTCEKSKEFSCAKLASVVTSSRTEVETFDVLLSDGHRAMSSKHCSRRIGQTVCKSRNGSAQRRLPCTGSPPAPRELITWRQRGQQGRQCHLHPPPPLPGVPLPVEQLQAINGEEDEAQLQNQMFLQCHGPPSFSCCVNDAQKV